MDQPEHHSTRKHGPNGDFVATPETAQRDAEAARLRGQGLGYQAIANQLGISVSTAYEAVHRALAAIRSEPAAEARTLELARLDRLYEAALKVLERRHVHISAGKVVVRATEYITDETGGILLDDEGRPRAHAVEELEDDAPVLAAIDRLLKIQARRAALLGLDAEKKINLSGGVKYEVVGISVEDLK